MHMPGHKRNPMFDGGAFPLSIDLTEVYGTDNLHSPESIILQSQQRAARLWGAKESYILVNGSTCGVLASVFAALKPEETVLIDRGSHVSVFNAVQLRQLKAGFLMPDYDSKTGIRAGISYEETAKGLQAYPEAKACIITSPTYEGAVCDIKSIATLCHSHGIPLIVDSAHGAHLGFSEKFPESAVKCGADAVIMSLHKTLPALTQTALLHVSGNLINPASIRKYLAVFQTSSPSYILMASADYCINLLDAQHEKLFRDFSIRLNRFYRDTAALSVLSCPFAEINPFFGFDSSKITVSCGNSEISGYELQNILRSEFGIETEMATPSSILAITTVCDTDEGFSRFAQALLAVDKRLTPHETRCFELPLPIPFCKYAEHQAENLPNCLADIISSEGCISAGTLSVYPPGIPILLPGEVITPQVIEYIKKAKSCGGKLIGEERIITKLPER